jgi:hypothetical protein
MTHGGRLEEFEILGEMPRDRAGIPDHSVLSHCHNRFDHLASSFGGMPRSRPVRYARYRYQSSVLPAAKTPAPAFLSWLAWPLLRIRCISVPY